MWNLQYKAATALLGVSVLLTSCEVLDPPEETASYVHIEEIDLVILNPGEEGSGSHAIIDAWVYANDNLIGAFELPATIPILASGNTTITIMPGIKQNGISSTRVRYPFYNRHEEVVSLIPGEIIDVFPVVEYYDNAEITVIEDFESAGINFDRGSTSDTNLVTITTPSHVFEGNGSGEAYLDVDGGMNYWESRSDLNLVIPGGNDVYIEINYACNDTMLVGIVAENILGSTKKGILFLTPTFNGNGTPVWKKAYIDVSTEIGSAVDADTFEVYFEMLKTGGSYPHQPVAYLDNVKICHW